MIDHQFRRVLIVEDNPGDVLLLEVMLHDAFRDEVEIEAVGSMSEAQAVLAGGLGPLVLLDLTLPDSWGPETFRTLRRTDSSSPVVILTGLQDEAVALSLVREGAQDYLTKGQFDRATLARVVRYAWERQRIERELVERKAWWETVIQAIPDAVVISNRVGRVVFANKAASELWKVPEQDLAGRTLAELTVAPDPSSPEKAPSRQTAVRASDGREVPIEVSYSSFVIEDEPLLATVIRDLSERRRLEQQLVQTQKMEAMGHLSAGIAHDFNNLLAVVVGNLDLLKKMAGDQPPLLKKLDTALGAALRGANLTKRLLTFSRSRELKPERVDVPGMMESFLEMVRRTFGPEIRIQSQVAPGLPPIEVDPSELENVLLNLAVNARDAMPEGGLLVFRCELAVIGDEDLLAISSDLRPGPHIVLTVADTGTGMPREVVDRAFEPFFTTKEKGKGTGLGLSMVYGFAQQSGGAVRIYSEVGEGTSVRIFLPVGSGVEPRATSKEASGYHAPSGSRVLLVDDELDLLDVAETYLKGLGFEVWTAPDGPGALQLIDSEPPFHLLVTDVLMPGGMNGGQLAQRVREKQPQIRVIFTSGFPSQALVDKKVRLDAELVTKPYIEEDLIRVLARVMPTPT